MIVHRTRARRRLGWIGVALLWMVAAPAALAAQETIPVPPLTPEQQRTANEAMAQLRSPVTPFHTVDMCPSVPALRDSIRVAAAAGQSRERIVEDVIARYGERVRMLPKRSGVGLLAWLAPPLALVIGAVLVGRRLARARREAEAFPPPAADVSEVDRARLDAALREMEIAGEVEP